MLKHSLFILIVVVIYYPLFGYCQVNNNFFNRPTLSQLQQMQSPQLNPFQPINVNPNPPNGYPLLDPAYNQQQTSRAFIEQMQREEWQRQQRLEIEKQNQLQAAYRNTLALFNNSYQELLKLDPHNFSITKAIYLVENTFNKNAFRYQQFEDAIKQYAGFVKQILKKEGVSSKSNTALNYGIQKLFSQQNKVYDSKIKKTITLLPFIYDDSDNYGKKDRKQLYVSKLLTTGKGQCHSMPLFYLAVAEQLGAKAYLSFAPEHTFIQFADNKNQLYYFETTKGGIVSQNAMIQSGYISAIVLKNKIFLDTLSQQKLYAECLNDFLIGYIYLFGYDDFGNQVKEKILTLDPNNLRVKLIEANLFVRIASQKIYEAGQPSLKDLPKYPDAYQFYLLLQEKYKEIGDLGYKEMSKEAYNQWIKSIEKEKKQ